MLLNLSHISSEPLHQQIFRQVRGFILNGELAPGDPLPSIRGMAKAQKVSVITVGRAYDDLERAGLIHCRQGKPSIVADLSRKQRMALVRENLSVQLEPILTQALADGLSPDELESEIHKLIKLLGEQP